MTGIPDLGIRGDIMGRVLDPLLCVFLADIQSVGIGACMHVCVWYTELTCISNGVSILQGALNHWGRILPQGPTIQNNQLKKRVCVKILDFDL